MTHRATRACSLLMVAWCLACRPDAMRWSEGRPLTDARARALALWAPSIAVANDTMIVVGNVVTPDGKVGRGSMWGHGPAMHRRPPALDTLFGLYPRVTAVPRTGARHLMWAEPAQEDSVMWLLPGRSLWSATVGPAGTWSEPTRILAGAQVLWTPTMSSAPVVGPDGTLHAAVAVWSGSTNNQVLHLALGASGWRATSVHTGTATHTAIGLADNGHLAVAWVAQAQQQDGPSNAAHVAFSTDEGRTWRGAMRLDSGADEVSGQLRLLGLQDSFLALWGRYGDEPFALQSIHRARVKSGTGVVAALPAVDPGYPIYGFEAVRDVCDTVHLVVRHVTSSFTHADYAPLSDGVDTLQHVDRATPVSDVALAIANGRLTLVWVGRTGPGEFKSQVRTRPMLCGR